VRRQFAQDGVETRIMSPAEVTQFMQAEIDKWVPVAKRAMATK
jgi:tripartite-type tricarboxylate transporter receptor subunit TctC